MNLNILIWRRELQKFYKSSYTVNSSYLSNAIKMLAADAWVADIVCRISRDCLQTKNYCGFNNSIQFICIYLEINFSLYINSWYKVYD